MRVVCFSWSKPGARQLQARDKTGRVRDGRVALNGGAEVLSRYFGDVGGSSLRNAKGLASVRDPGRRLLAWRRVGQFGKDAPTRDQQHHSRACSWTFSYMQHLHEI